MALFVRQDESRTELQDRIAAELQEKARKRAQDAERPDGVDDSKYIEGTKGTSGLAWAWVLVGIGTVIAVVWLVIESTRP